MDEGRVTYYLDLWREYMRSDNNKLGYKSKSTGFNTGGIHSFEDMADELDYESAKIVDRVIDDLPYPQREAVNIFYLGINTMMDLDTLEQLYDTALIMLQKRLPEKNLY
jgi:hypothetical protein